MSRARRTWPWPTRCRSFRPRRGAIVFAPASRRFPRDGRRAGAVHPTPPTPPAEHGHAPCESGPSMVRAPLKLVLDPVVSAERAHLRWVSDDEPGITRERVG